MTEYLSKNLVIFALICRGSVNFQLLSPASFIVLWKCEPGFNKYFGIGFSNEICTSA